MKPDYDTTLARIAGTIAAGLVHIDPFNDDWVVIHSLGIAQAIVARCRRQAQAEQRPPNMPSAASNSSSSRPNTTSPSST